MKNLTASIVLFTAMFLSFTLHAQVKASGYNQPCLQLSGSGADAALTWTTIREVNSRYFLVETSKDSIHFTTLKTVPASGSSAFTKTYEESELIIDAETFIKVTLVDMNGNRFSSKVLRTSSSNMNAVAWE